MIGTVSERLSKLDDFVKRLEGRDEEDRCLQVRASSLHVSLERWKLQNAMCGTKCSRRIVKKNNGGGGTNNNKKEKDCIDKKNWMSFVQLWNTDNYQHPSSDFPYDRKQVSEINSKTYHAFSVTAARKEEKEELPVHGLMDSGKENVPY
ncbi:unnamed protein product [Prunus armeniaca]